MRHALYIVTALILTKFFYEDALANDTVDNAFKLCHAMEATGLLSDKCEVSGRHQTVSMVMDTSASEARKICVGMSTVLIEKGLSFDRGWKLKIYSPYSGNRSIAMCNL